MKKVLGLVMALVLILSAVSAFAAVPSKTTEDLVVIQVEDDVIVVATNNETPAVTELLTALIADNTAIPAEAKKALPEGSSYKEVTDAATLQIIGEGTAEKDLVVSLSFATDYANKKVALLLGVLENGVIKEWKTVEATGKSDGTIDLVLDGTLQDWLGGREFIVLVAQ